VKILKKVQKSALYQRVVEEYGEPEDWPETFLTNGIDLVQSLSVEDLKKVQQKAKSALVKALKQTQKVEWSRDQV